tara:strand:+ start:2108 stop:2458 length:351 start_codon:yes stop_codon:yes gene_type:complete
MKNNFDDPVPEAPKPKKQEFPIERWAAIVIKQNKGKWVSLILPEHGNVNGKCIDMKFTGKDRSGIPDFELTIQGKNNTVKAPLVDSRAMFHDSELESLERWVTQWDLSKSEHHKIV